MGESIVPGEGDLCGLIDRACSRREIRRSGGVWERVLLSPGGAEGVTDPIQSPSPSPPDGKGVSCTRHAGVIPIRGQSQSELGEAGVLGGSCVAFPGESE